MVCDVFGVPRSSYYDFWNRDTSIKPKEVELRAKINEFFSAGSRTLVAMLSESGVSAGVFKVRRIIRDMELICKQPGSHAYKSATVGVLTFRICLIASLTLMA